MHSRSRFRWKVRMPVCHNNLMLVWSKNAIFGVDCVTSVNGKPSSSAEWWSQDCINTDATDTCGTEIETEKKGLEWTGHHHLHKLYNRRTILRCIGIINIPMHLTGCIWRRACRTRTRLVFEATMSRQAHNRDQDNVILSLVASTTTPGCCQWDHAGVKKNVFGHSWKNYFFTNVFFLFFFYCYQ